MILVCYLSILNNIKRVLKVIIGKNLKPAKEFGMKTIKVTFEPNCVEKAINQLEELLKCNLSCM